MSTEERLEKMDNNLQQIKIMLVEILNHQKQLGNEKDSIMSLNEVSEYLGLEKHIIYSKCGSGQIPFFRVGKLYKFKKSELQQWLKDLGLKKSMDVDEYVNRYLQAHILRG
jgi:excisionase family DNA binding protein